MKGEHSAYAFNKEGEYTALCRFVDAETAMLAAGKAAQTDGVERVIITDGGDCTNFEWTRTLGVVYPPTLNQRGGTMEKMTPEDSNLITAAATIRIKVLRNDNRIETLELTGPFTITRGEQQHRLRDEGTGRDHFFDIDGKYNGWGQELATGQLSSMEEVRNFVEDQQAQREVAPPSGALVVWRLPLHHSYGTSEIEVPADMLVLTFALSPSGRPSLWFTTSGEEAPRIKHKLHVMATGENVSYDWLHLGTLNVHGAVHHYFLELQ